MLNYGRDGKAREIQINRGGEEVRQGGRGR
jgi:hypothetical protein